MQPKRDYTIPLLLALFLYACLVSCKPMNKVITTEHTYETDDTKFHNGEILLPDYVHLDTLVVTDAKFINWAMEYYDAASDGDIMDILRSGTEKYSIAPQTENIVIKSQTDLRGLTSVVFVTPSNDTFALDYLTRKEYRRMFKQSAVKTAPYYIITCNNDTLNLK